LVYLVEHAMQGNYFWYNNVRYNSERWKEIQSVEGIVVYEVIRIIDGIPLFFEEHYQRLIYSCKLIGNEYEPDRNKLFQQFIELVISNGFETGNVTLKLIFSEKENCRINIIVNQPIVPQVIIYFIPHSYPTSDQYLHGVSVGFLEAERNNPEAKVEQGYRKKANELLKNDDLYELLLVDRNGLITEGSKSNMIFVKEGALYTCPLNRVLTGITLKKVLEIASRDSIPVVFEAVPLKEISSCDALFITGTSPKILPVANVQHHQFDTQNRQMRHLMQEYDLLIEQDINNRKILQ
jgi:branched-chain amino acid aminotransferase